MKFLDSNKRIHRYSPCSLSLMTTIIALSEDISVVWAASLLMGACSVVPQLSNQGACIQEVPEASNRANTIFMTTYFIGGSLGTLCAGQGWIAAEWMGVCIVGLTFAFASLIISILFDRYQQ